MRYNCFTVLVSAVQQRESAISIPVSPSSWVSLLPLPLTLPLSCGDNTWYRNFILFLTPIYPWVCLYPNPFLVSDLPVCLLQAPNEKARLLDPACESTCIRILTRMHCGQHSSGVFLLCQLHIRYTLNRCQLRKGTRQEWEMLWGSELPAHADCSCSVWM